VFDADNFNAPEIDAHGKSQQSNNKSTGHLLIGSRQAGF
jgi:hypothetical protein